MGPSPSAFVGGFGLGFFFFFQLGKSAPQIIGVSKEKTTMENSANMQATHGFSAK